MTSPLALLAAVRLQGFTWDATDHVRSLWEDEDGLEQSVEKMLYLGGAIVLAVAAITFLYTQFGAAKSKVPSPNLPTGP